MQRPIMHPGYGDEASTRPRRTLFYIGAAGRWVGRWLGRGIALLSRDIFGRNERPNRPELSQRILRALSYRLLFMPLVAVLLAAALVYRATHGPTVASAIDPTCEGMYYDSVNYLGEGNVQLEAWMIPALDAQRVLAEKDRILAERRPAVVLVHDDGASRQQMLPLVAPLHRQGYVVMVISLRGCEGSTLGSTFGLNEAGDVEAALTVLQRTPLVDSDRLAIIGLGTGANAALIAAQHNLAVRALIINAPHSSFDDAFTTEMTEHTWWMRSISPLCRWTFEVAYGVNAADLDLQRCLSELQMRSDKPAILLFDGSATESLKQEKRAAVVDFLAATLNAKAPKS